MFIGKIFNSVNVIKHINRQATCALREASNYKRPQLNIIPRERINTLKLELFRDRTELTVTEWQELRQTLIEQNKHINAINVDAHLLAVFNEGQQLHLAKNYVNHLQKTGIEPNGATLGRLLRVYNTAYHERGAHADSLSEEEQSEILHVIKSIRDKHDVLDATSCDNLIHGVVTTNQWPMAKDLLDMIKITCAPSVSAYTEIIAKSFQMGEMAFGWQLLTEMLGQMKQPRCDVFLAYLDNISRDANMFSQNFNTFLLFIEAHELIITEKVIERIQELAKRFPSTLFATKAIVNRVGKCDSCSHFLKNVSISSSEFEELSECFLQKVLVRNDVFLKSTPEEVERFKQFVTNTAPYDCVIDGLNVAYSTGVKKSPHVLAKLVAAVVKHFNDKNKHVLVLGRKHMNSWPKNTMQYVHRNSSVFFTNNLSQDDPFLLYATLQSGQSTDFFSRDLMRSHSHLLGQALQSTFRRWQQEHQYSLTTIKDSGKIIVKEPVRYLLSAHRIQNTWHIPYKDEYSINSAHEIPTKWLCIKLQK